MNKAKAIAAGLIFGSAAALGIIHKWEIGRDLTEYRVYADKLAGGLPTSECNGITPYVATIPMKIGDVWSEAQCVAQTKQALAKVQGALIGCFKLLPPQSVFDAATSHAWNFGASKTCGSAAMSAWNRGEWQLGCRRLQLSDGGRPVWSYSGGKFYSGLYNRRGEERRLCETGKN